MEKGDSRSIEVALKVLERQAKLNGLDAPAKQEVKVSYAELTDDELLAEADRLKLYVDVKVLGVDTPLLLPGETLKQAAPLTLNLKGEASNSTSSEDKCSSGEHSTEAHRLD